ncbi:MAG: serine hydrolase [bacterium]|nr:class A beta-lactamase-related serine hydrolase [Candidatus Sumerlaeota bacterium]
MTHTLKLCVALALALSASASCAFAQLELQPGVRPPELPCFRPLPAPDPQFSEQIAGLVRQAKLDEHTSASQNPDNEEEWSSICVVDLSDPSRPCAGGWEADNFVYPASAYKMYVVGEAVRQVCAGERGLDDITTVSANNMRPDTRLTTGQAVTLAEVLRLVCMYSDNTAANVAIDIVDRQRASALLRAMGCIGSDVTRKFLPRSREDAGYTTIPGTTSSARHFAAFLWAVETGAVGGGRGRGLIKGLLATNITNADRMRAGLPPSATIYSKTGEWDTFTSEAGIVEDGATRYILCILTAMPHEQAAPRIAAFTRSVHELLHR